MENVKFVRYEKEEGIIVYYFKIHDRLADFVRKNTHYQRNHLSLYLTKDNLFSYMIETTDDFTEMHDSFVEAVERISNSGDDEFFYNHLITENGYPRSPREIHELIHSEYGLADIDYAADLTESEESSDNTAKNLEWWVAHFFISFSGMIFDEPIEDDDNDREHHIRVAADPAFISELLEKLKDMDIVLVDDARKVGVEEMKAFREKMANEGNGSESGEPRVLDLRTKK